MTVSLIQTSIHRYFDAYSHQESTPETAIESAISASVDFLQSTVDIHQTYAKPIDLASFSDPFRALYKQIMDPHTRFRQPEDYERFSLRYQDGAWGRSEVGTFVKV